MTDSEEMAARYVDRFERLFGEIDGLNEDIGEISKQAKDEGFDPALLKKVAKIRLKDKAKEEAEKIALLQTYGRAAGVQLELGIGGAVRDFVGSVPRGGSVTIEAGESSVTIAKDEAGNLIHEAAA